MQDDNTDTVRWTKHQLSIPLTWVCHGEARLRNNAVLQAMACQGDDGGLTVATSLTDRMSASVGQLWSLVVRHTGVSPSLRMGTPAHYEP